MSRPFQSQYKVPFTTVVFFFLLATCFVTSTLSIRTDDSYIFLTYARNIFHGWGYVFNQGEYINGTTSPLFTLLIAALAAPLSLFPGDPFFSASLIVQLIALFSIFYFGDLLLSTHKHRLAPISFALLLTCNSLLTLGIGMETFLAMALGLACLRADQVDRVKLKYLLLGLAVLARPDMGILAIVIFFSDCLRGRIKDALCGSLIATALCTPWLIFSYLYFGSVLPSTLAAKLAQTDTGRWGAGLIYLQDMRQVLGSYGGATIIILLLSALLGAKYIRESRACLLLLTWIAGYFVIYSFVLNPPAYPWYYCIFSLPCALIVCLGLERLLQFISQSHANQLTKLSIWALLVALTGSHLWALYQKPFDSKYIMYQRLATWLNQVPGALNTSVAINEVGILAYNFSGRVIDPLGLVTAGGAQAIAEKKYDWYVEKLKPDYIVTKDPPRTIIETFVEQPKFLEHYKLVKVLRTRQRSSRIYQRLTSQ